MVIYKNTNNFVYTFLHISIQNVICKKRLSKKNQAQNFSIFTYNLITVKLV